MRATLSCLPLLLAGAARADEVTPAPAHAAERETREQSTTPSEAGYPAHTWELPAIEVAGERRPALREEERIGAYRQPRWTAVRRFPTTRVYVVPEGKMEFEWWIKYKAPLDALDDERVIETLYEWEMGLGHRLQLDLYLVTEQKGPDGPFALKGEKVEVRWALGDWGALPANPTLYLEWVRNNANDDKVEAKLLLGDELAPRWHAGVNLVFERVLGGADEQEYKVTGGVGYTLIDEKLSLGLEALVAGVDAAGSRFDFAEKEYYAGPSLMWTPVPPAHVLVTPLVGAVQADETRGAFQTLVVVGWAF